MQARDIQEKETRMSMNLPYVNVLLTNYGVYSYLKTRSSFYTKSTLHKLICKQKDWRATEDKNNSVYEIECSKLETVNYFSKSKQTLNPCSDEHNRSVRNCDCENDEIAKLRWQRNHNFT